MRPTKIGLIAGMEFERFQLLVFAAPALLMEAQVKSNEPGAIRSGMRSILRTLRENPILAIYITLALVVRLAFWFYTGRVWEDALITITAARNVWEV
jgi:hypothetical protein